MHFENSLFTRARSLKAFFFIYVNKHLTAEKSKQKQATAVYSYLISEPQKDK